MSVLEQNFQRLATIARSALRAPKYSSYDIYHLDEILNVMTAMIPDQGRRVPSRRNTTSCDIICVLPKEPRLRGKMDKYLSLRTIGPRLFFRFRPNRRPTFLI